MTGRTFGAGLCTKEERAAKMGMTALTSDVAAQRRALQMTFLEAESAAASRLAEVDAVRADVENACSIKLPAGAPSAAASPVHAPDLPGSLFRPIGRKQLAWSSSGLQQSSL